jgi:Cu/Ag efflux pump CusA
MPGCAARPSASRTCSSPAADQGEIPLTSLAAITTTDGPVLVRRENGSRFALIQSSERARSGRLRG